jgi:hypothetical protein
MASRNIHIIVLSILFVHSAWGLIHDLKIKNDRRPNGFFIENFGFDAGGVIDMKILDFKVNYMKIPTKLIN